MRRVARRTRQASHGGARATAPKHHDASTARVSRRSVGFARGTRKERYRTGSAVFSDRQRTRRRPGRGEPTSCSQTDPPTRLSRHDHSNPPSTRRAAVPETMTRSQLRTVLFEHVEVFYNRRRHRQLRGLSPSLHPRSVATISGASKSPSTVAVAATRSPPSR